MFFVLSFILIYCFCLRVIAFYYSSVFASTVIESGTNLLYPRLRSSSTARGGPRNMAQVRTQALDLLAVEEALWMWARKISEAVRQRLEQDDIRVYDWDVQVEMGKAKARITWRFMIDVSGFFEPENRCVYYEDAYYFCQTSVIEWAKEEGINADEDEDKISKKVEECVSQYIEEELSDARELPFKYEYDDFVEIKARLKTIEEENVDRVCVYDVVEVTIMRELFVDAIEYVLENEDVVNMTVDDYVTKIKTQYDVVKMLAGY